MKFPKKEAVKHCGEWSDMQKICFEDSFYMSQIVADGVRSSHIYLIFTLSYLTLWLIAFALLFIIIDIWFNLFFNLFIISEYKLAW